MVRIIRTGQFNQSLDKVLLKNPNLVSEIDTRIKWFHKNPKDTRLDNHQLTKRMSSKWAFSITDDIRIIYEWLNKNTIRFREIGSHVEVYPRSKKQSPKR